MVGLDGPCCSVKDWAARGPLNVGPSGSVSRLLSWLVMTMVNGIHHGVTSVEYGTCTINVSNTVLWALVGTAWTRHPQTAAELQEALGASAAGRTGVRPYARSNSGQARMCCRQVALDAEVARLHAAERTVPLVMVATPRWICSARHRTQRARAYKSVDKARPDRTRRDAMGERQPMGQKSCHTVQDSTDLSPVQSSSGDPRILQGRGVRDEKARGHG